MPRIITFLSYDDRAEEAAKFYISVFPRSRIKATTRYGDAGPGAKGSVMTVTFEIDGQDYVALNGGPSFKFTDGVSLSVECKTQEEVDTYWEKLSEGGEKRVCGWLKDKFGLSWQVTPTALIELLSDPDPAKSKRVMEAMMKMKKIVIADLKRAIG
ncbi:MAG: VOC family protein [Polyangiaceae bacterium]|jgi:predicted 3-demethylubiquinone-9 3-methyltransferase (glyoxalase superfamily)